jgi:hypothetical protein
MIDLLTVVVGVFVGGAVSGAVTFLWGRRVGRAQERERVQDQLYRLHKEGLVSADLRIILSIRLDPDYDEPVFKPRNRSE